LFRLPCRAPAAGLALILSLLSPPGHAVWQWLRGAAITDFKDSDWALLQETARTVLNDKPDREQVNWSNPETGNRGSILALATFQHSGQKCRRVAMRNITHRGREDRGAYSLCQQADGTWQFVPESVLLATDDTTAEAAPAPASDDAEAPPTDAGPTPPPEDPAAPSP
jgi:surface antigen